MKIALLFGLNYKACASGHLRGCHEDVQNIKKYLQKEHAYLENNIRAFNDEENPQDTSKDGIVSNIMNLAKESWKQPIKEVFIHYSGHGGQMFDTQRKENDNKNECLIPSDYEKNGVISDDYLNRLFQCFNPNTHVIFVCDACHSGTMADTKYKYNIDTENDEIIETQNNDAKNIDCDLICISGCKDSQTSADAYNVNDKHLFSGALSSCLLQALKEKKGDTQISCQNLFKNVKNLLKQKGFTQLPIITSSRNLDFQKRQLFI